VRPCSAGLAAYADWTSVLSMPTIPEMERVLRERLESFPPAARAALLHVLMQPDFDRAAPIGELGEPRNAVVR
jgi:hypothetical protein